MKKISWNLYTLIFGIFLFGGGCRADDLGVEAAVLSRISSAIEAYADLSGGAYPESWKELLESDAWSDRAVDRLLHSPLNADGDTVMDLYSFVRSEDRAKFPRGELILIRKTPGGTKPSRLVLFMNHGGYVSVHGMREEEVQVMLSETGIKLSSPESDHMTGDGPDGLSDPVVPQRESAGEDSFRYDESPGISGGSSPTAAEENRDRIVLSIAVVFLLSLLLTVLCLRRRRRGDGAEGA